MELGGGLTILALAVGPGMRHAPAADLVMAVTGRATRRAIGHGLARLLIGNAVLPGMAIPEHSIPDQSIPKQWRAALS